MNTLGIHKYIFLLALANLVSCSPNVDDQATFEFDKRKNPYTNNSTTSDEDPRTLGDISVELSLPSYAPASSNIISLAISGDFQASDTLKVYDDYNNNTNLYFCEILCIHNFPIISCKFTNALFVIHKFTIFLLGMRKFTNSLLIFINSQFAHWQFVNSQIVY